MLCQRPTSLGDTVFDWIAIISDKRYQCRDVPPLPHPYLEGLGI